MCLCQTGLLLRQIFFFLNNKIKGCFLVEVGSRTDGSQRAFGKMALTEGLVGPAHAKGGNAKVLLPRPASPEHRTTVVSGFGTEQFCSYLGPAETVATLFF